MSKKATAKAKGATSAETAPAGPGGVKLRIIGEGAEAPDQLLANPKNWRKHTRQQKAAMLDLLKTVGWVQRVIVNKRTGNMVDGHMRVELAMEQSLPAVPVVYIDVSQEEEDLLLATLDPLGDLAETDAEKLEELLKELDPDGVALKAILADLEAQLGIGEEEEEDDDEVLLDQAIQIEPPREYVMILCEDEGEFQELRRVFELKLVRRGGYKKGSPFDDNGIERVVKAQRLIEMLTGDGK